MYARLKNQKRAFCGFSHSKLSKLRKTVIILNKGAVPEAHRILSKPSQECGVPAAARNYREKHGNEK
jgi:hypothetical protein